MTSLPSLASCLTVACFGDASCAFIGREAGVKIPPRDPVEAFTCWSSPTVSPAPLRQLNELAIRRALLSASLPIFPPDERMTVPEAAGPFSVRTAFITALSGLLGACAGIGAVEASLPNAAVAALAPLTGLSAAKTLDRLIER